jgi:hypothetical protein
VNVLLGVGEIFDVIVIFDVNFLLGVNGIVIHEVNVLLGVGENFDVMASERPDDYVRLGVTVNFDENVLCKTFSPPLCKILIYDPVMVVFADVDLAIDCYYLLPYRIQAKFRITSIFALVSL